MNIIRETPRNFNTCLFTEGGTPLPLSDTEKLLYVGENVGFATKVGEGGLLTSVRYFSSHGTLFITNYRLVYIPRVYQHMFCSFFTPSTSIIDVADVGGKKAEITLTLQGGMRGKINLRMRNNLIDTMIVQLRKSQEYLSSLE